MCIIEYFNNKSRYLKAIIFLFGLLSVSCTLLTRKEKFNYFMYLHKNNKKLIKLSQLIPLYD